MTNWDQASIELSKKLDPAHVKGRKQGGGQVQYIEGWHAIAEANRIFGFGAWDRETVDIRLLGQPREVNGNVRVDYMARVRISVELDDGNVVVRDGCGFGQGIDRDVGQSHESALKEAETDAMKRALMTFGNPFGLALYVKSRENVGVDEPKAPVGPSQLEIDLDRLIEAATDRDALAGIWTKETQNKLWDLGGGALHAKYKDLIAAKAHQFPSPEQKAA